MKFHQNYMNLDLILASSFSFVIEEHDFQNLDRYSFFPSYKLINHQLLQIYFDFWSLINWFNSLFRILTFPQEQKCLQLVPNTNLKGHLLYMFFIPRQQVAPVNLNANIHAWFIYLNYFLRRIIFYLIFSCFCSQSEDCKEVRRFYTLIDNPFRYLCNHCWQVLYLIFLNQFYWAR